MNHDCTQALGSLPLWADGELPALEITWIESHWEQCADCRTERDRFQNLDARLRSFGEKIGAPAEEVKHLQRKPLLFLPAAAALLAAAAVLVLIWLPPKASRTIGTDPNGFVPVPYVPPIASYERSSVVSMQIPVANLLAEGYNISADPSSLVQADVLLGEDGRMHAVRLAANQILKGVEE